MNPFLRAWSTTDLSSNVWRLREFEFDKLNSSFYFFINKSIVIPRERSYMGCYLFCWKIYSVPSHVFGTICVLSPTLIFSCTTCWAFMHLLCQVSNEYQTSICFNEWPQFISDTVDLKLLRQISTFRPLLKKRHT